MNDEIIAQYCQIIKNKISCLRFDSALTSIEKLTINYPKNPIGFYFEGVCLFATRDFDGAIKSYKKALKLDENFAKAYFNLGVCYYILDDWDTALICFGKALLIFTREKELDKKQRCINAIKHIRSSS